MRATCFDGAGANGISDEMLLVGNWKFSGQTTLKLRL